MLLRSKMYLTLNQEYLIHDPVLFLFIAISLKFFNFSIAGSVLLHTLYPSLDSYFTES